MMMMMTMIMKMMMMMIIMMIIVMIITTITMIQTSITPYKYNQPCHLGPYFAGIH